jgi:inosine/xanthosine triphosphate pyrophosphatase family protein
METIEIIKALPILSIDDRLTIATIALDSIDNVAKDSILMVTAMKTIPGLYRS